MLFSIFSFYLNRTHVTLRAKNIKRSLILMLWPDQLTPRWERQAGKRVNVENVKRDPTRDFQY